MYIFFFFFRITIPVHLSLKKETTIKKKHLHLQVIIQTYYLRVYVILQRQMNFKPINGHVYEHIGVISVTTAISQNTS